MFWLALKTFASGALKRVLKALSSASHWLFADWRNGPLVVCAAMWMFHSLFVNPARLKAIAARDEEIALVTKERDDERAAHAQSIINIRKASEDALAAAEANAARVAAEQAAINQEEISDYQTRLAAARSRFDQLALLRRTAASASARPGAGRADPAGVPGPGTDPARIAETPGEAGLPPAALTGELAAAERPRDLVCLTLDEAWLATAQALQLDALITILNRQQLVIFSPEGTPE